MNLPITKSFEPFTKIASLKLRTKKPNPAEIEKKELLNNFIKTGEEIDHAMAQFNDATEKLLIDMYAYEIKALEQKHSYYLLRMKQMNVKYPQS